MRFAFKTSPQHTTWAQLLAVWQAADDIDVYESGWTFDHFYPIFSDTDGPCLEGWTTLTRLIDGETTIIRGMYAALYTRISQDATGERAGVTRQLDDCSELAERLGAPSSPTSTTTTSRAFSGKTRPGFEAMLEPSLKRGEADTVIAGIPTGSIGR